MTDISGTLWIGWLRVGEVNDVDDMIQLTIDDSSIADSYDYMLDPAFSEVIDCFPRLSLSMPLTWRSRASAEKRSIRLAHGKHYAVVVLGHNVR
jgi:hypothetical protein